MGYIKTSAGHFLTGKGRFFSFSGIMARDLQYTNTKGKVEREEGEQDYILVTLAKDG